MSKPRPDFSKIPRCTMYEYVYGEGYRIMTDASALCRELGCGCKVIETEDSLSNE